MAASPAMDPIANVNHTTGQSRYMLSRLAVGDLPSAEELSWLLLTCTWDELAGPARELRQQGKGAAITYSPKVFLPLTNLCQIGRAHV